MSDESEKPKKKPGPPKGSKRTTKTEIFSVRVTPKQKIALQKVLDAMREANGETLD